MSNRSHDTFSSMTSAQYYRDRHPMLSANAIQDLERSHGVQVIERLEAIVRPPPERAVDVIERLENIVSPPTDSTLGGGRPAYSHGPRYGVYFDRLIGPTNILIELQSMFPDVSSRLRLLSIRDFPSFHQSSTGE